MKASCSCALIIHRDLLLQHLLQPSAVFSGFTVAPRIPLPAPGVCKNPDPQMSNLKFSPVVVCKESTQILTCGYQESRKQPQYYFLFLSSLPLCHSQKFKASFMVSSATKFSTYSHLCFCSLNKHNSLTVSSQERCSCENMLIIFVVLFWTHSNRTMSFLS